MRAFSGLAIGIAAGTLLALIAGLSRFGESVIDGPIQIKRSIPTLALIPLLILWLGINEEMKILTIALAVMIPVYIHTHNGLRSIDGRYAELAETVDVGRVEFIRSVVLPGAMPGFLLGLRFAVTTALLSLVVVEQYQRHRRHRLHDQPRAELRPDRRHRRGPRRLCAAGSRRRQHGATHREEGAGMASNTGKLTDRTAVRVSGAASQLQRGRRSPQRP